MVAGLHLSSGRSETETDAETGTGTERLSGHRAFTRSLRSPPSVPGCRRARR